MKYMSKAVRFMINLLLTAIFFVPLYWMALTAFKTAAQALQSPPAFWVRNPQWGNFARAIEVIPFFSFSEKLADCNRRDYGFAGGNGDSCSVCFCQI